MREGYSLAQGKQVLFSLARGLTLSLPNWRAVPVQRWQKRSPLLRRKTWSCAMQSMAVHTFTAALRDCRSLRAMLCLDGRVLSHTSTWKRKAATVNDSQSGVSSGALLLQSSTGSPLNYPRSLERGLDRVSNSGSFRLSHIYCSGISEGNICIRRLLGRWCSGIRETELSRGQPLPLHHKREALT